MQKYSDRKVVLDHGTGAKLSRELVEFIVDVLGDVYIGEMEDSATLQLPAGNIAMTTDSFVVDPLIFGNGDIGKIAVCGTVNDLAVVGATPLYLTLALIIESGLPFTQLGQVLHSVRTEAKEAGVKIVAGDTKVVNNGEADKLFLNTAGVGVFMREPLRMQHVRDGDVILLSGPIGNHAVHLLSIREGLGFETRVLSDCAVLNHMIDALLEGECKSGIRSIRDVTRGGLRAVMHEYSRVGPFHMVLDKDSLPLQHETVMACDMLGIDPLDLANEGCLCVFVAPEQAQAALDVMRRFAPGALAVEVGKVRGHTQALVSLQAADGASSQLEELEGAALPRLC
jgi:hydrogenase expression/formation protein HypE